MKTKPTINNVFQSIYLLFIILVFNNCTPSVELPPKELNELVISEYINTTPDYSEFDALVRSVKLNDLLSIRGPYTLFLPNNAAMKAYYAEKNVSSYTDLDTSFRKEIVYNHLVPKSFAISDFRLGTLGEKNALGDYIVTEFSGAEIILNKYSRIVKRDIKLSNGTVHIVEKVLDPLKRTVYEDLANRPGYSLFAAGLEKTGIKDTLQVVHFQYGKYDVRTRFTILAVPDSVYQSLGITTIDQLIARYTNKPDSIKYPGNGFYDYIDYHCLDKNSYYFTDIPAAATLYSVVSKNNNVQIKMQGGIYKINPSADGSTYTSIIIPKSDIPAKNGVIHTIDKPLDVTTPAPTTVIWEVTDFFDFKLGEYYLKHFQKFYDPNQFAGIKWQGEYLLYYLKDPSLAFPEMNNDCLSMTGFFDIEVTTPKIMKGKYQIGGRVQVFAVSYAVYVDGELKTVIKSGQQPTLAGAYKADSGNLHDFGIVDWKTTTTHKVRLKCLKDHLFFWDRLEFTPIN